MPWDGIERRRRKRYGVKDAVVRYKKGSPIAFLVPPSNKYLLLNLSQDGLEFISREMLESGRTVHVQISAPVVAGAVHARGRVVWSKKSQDKDACRIGVEFTRVSARSLALLKAILASSVVDTLDLSTRDYLKELERL